MSNLPPGVTTSMLPGNRPEDHAYEEWVEDLYARIAALLPPECDDGVSDSLVTLIEAVIAEHDARVIEENRAVQAEIDETERLHRLDHPQPKIG